MKTIIFLGLVFLPVLFLNSLASDVTHTAAERHFLIAADSLIDYAAFVNPPDQYRSHPFYSLNDELEPEELRRQIHGFKQAGFGGFYLHSRPGLITDYLSDEWWRMMDVAVDAAKEVDLRCMFYDEDKWPSGYAGGLIPDLGEDYRAKCLARLDLATPLPVGSKILKKDSLYQYIEYTAQYGYAIFNGTCYVDLYNPNAVKAFIESTHRPYFEKYGDKVAENALFIFTDEPHMHARYFDRNTKHRGVLSYSPYLDKKFQDLYGYSLIDHVDLLFEEKHNWREVRWHYHMAKALLYEESFTRQIADFCDQHGAQFTGHYLGEDDLKKVRDRIGNSSLHYRSMQQPGIDHLGLSTANRLLTPKYLSSVANQFEKRSRLSELFGISGQNINFQERKWLGGWHAILGINHFCPHLTSYSIQGARKRDYPPTFSYHQPYWKENKTIEDYLGRISYAATIGQFDPQALIISPLESEYVKNDGEGEFTSSLKLVMQALQDQHIDYDLGDEEIIKDEAKVAGRQFIIGAMQYQTIVLPRMLTIRRSTLSLLLQFHENGGTILSCGEFPQFVDAKENEKAINTLKEAVVVLPADKLKENLRQHIQPTIKLRGDHADQIWTQSRTLQGKSFYLLYNNSNTAAVDISLQWPEGQKNFVLWDPAKVSTHALAIDQKGQTQITLAPAGFYWISTGALSDGIPTESISVYPNDLKPLQTIDTPWTGKRNDPNALTLDFAAYSIDGGKTYSTPEPVIGIWSRLNDDEFRGELQLKFFAEIKALPESCSLAMEQPEAFKEVSINGTSIRFDGQQYFIGQSIKIQDITSLLKVGQNEIHLTIPFSPTDPLSRNPVERYETELESIYLVGDFGVYGDNEPFEDTQRNRSEDMVKRPVYAFTSYTIDQEKTHFDGNLALEGYPFFAGGFTLSNAFNLSSFGPYKKVFPGPGCQRGHHHRSDYQWTTSRYVMLGALSGRHYELCQGG